MQRLLIVLSIISVVVSVNLDAQELSTGIEANLYRTVQPHEIAAQVMQPSRAEFVDGRLILFDPDTVQALISHDTLAAASKQNGSTEQAAVLPPDSALFRMQLPSSHTSSPSAETSVLLKTTRVSDRGNGVTVWQGTSADGTGSASLTISSDGRCFGRLMVSGETFIIMPVSNGTHYLARLDRNVINSKLSGGYDRPMSNEEYVRELERARKVKLDSDNNE